MSLLGKIRYRIYSIFNMDVAFRKEKFIQGGGKLGVDCEIYPDVEFGSEPYMITIGNHVRITNGVRFVTMPNNHHLEDPRVIDRLLPWSEELPKQCRLKTRQKKCLKQ